LKHRGTRILEKGVEGVRQPLMLQPLRLVAVHCREIPPIMITKASTVLKGPLKEHKYGEAYHQGTVKKTYIPLATVCFRIWL